MLRFLLVRARLFALLTVGMWGVVSRLHAAPSNRVVAVVAGKPVLASDLEDRLRFLALMTGSEVKRTKEMWSIALSGLRDEILQEGMTKALGVRVSDAEVDEAIAGLARASRVSMDALKENFQNQGVPWTLLVRRFRTQLAWRQYIQQRYGRDSVVSEQEVQQKLALRRSYQGQKAYRLAEIILYGGRARKEKLRVQATHLLSLLREGISFQVLAQQFSEAATAKEAGGYVGWRYEGEMGPAELRAMRAIQPGQVTEPVELPYGYGLFVLIEEGTPQQQITEESVRQALQQERFALYAQRELLRLRRQALAESSSEQGYEGPDEEADT
jgi:peptidyl-prolyl cis-trans isomerase SurA